MPPEPSGRLIWSSRIRRYGVWYATRVDSCSIAGPEVSRTGLTLPSSLDGSRQGKCPLPSELQMALRLREGIPRAPPNKPVMGRRMAAGALPACRDGFSVDKPVGQPAESQRRAVTRL